MKNGLEYLYFATFVFAVIVLINVFMGNTIPNEWNKILLVNNIFGICYSTKNKSIGGAIFHGLGVMMYF